MIGIIIVITILLSRFWLWNYYCLRLSWRFTGPNAFVPRVFNLRVVTGSTVFEPRTAASTTTASTGFRDGTAFGAYETDVRRRCCWDFYVRKCFKTQRERGVRDVNAITIYLTPLASNLHLHAATPSSHL